MERGWKGAASIQLTVLALSRDLHFLRVHSSFQIKITREQEKKTVLIKVLVLRTKMSWLPYIAEV